MGHRAGLDLSPQSPGLQRGQVPGQHPFFPGQIQRRGSEVRLGGVIWECHRLVSECQLCSRAGLTPAQGTRSPLGGLGDHRAADAAPSPSEGAPPPPPAGTGRLPAPGPAWFPRSSAPRGRCYFPPAPPLLARLPQQAQGPGNAALPHASLTPKSLPRHTRDAAGLAPGLGQQRHHLPAIGVSGRRRTPPSTLGPSRPATVFT